MNLKVRPVNCIHLADLSSSPLMKVWFYVKNYDVVALLDMGASHSLITKKCATLLNVEILNTNTPKIYSIADTDGLISPRMAELTFTWLPKVQTSQFSCNP